MDIQKEVKALERKERLIKRIKSAQRLVKTKERIWEREKKKLEKLIEEYNSIGKENHANESTKEFTENL